MLRNQKRRSCGWNYKKDLSKSRVCCRERHDLAGFWRETLTRYFHLCVKDRYHRNRILSLQGHDDAVEGVNQVRKAIFDHFSSFYSPDSWNRPSLDGISFHSIALALKFKLVERFSVQEIEDMLADCDGNRGPGLDGFNFFYKKSWNIFK